MTNEKHFLSCIQAALRRAFIDGAAYGFFGKSFDVQGAVDSAFEAWWGKQLSGAKPPDLYVLVNLDAGSVHGVFANLTDAHEAAEKQRGLSVFPVRAQDFYPQFAR